MRACSPPSRQDSLGQAMSVRAFGDTGEAGRFVRRLLSGRPKKMPRFRRAQLIGTSVSARRHAHRASEHLPTVGRDASRGCDYPRRTLYATITVHSRPYTHLNAPDRRDDFNITIAVNPLVAGHAPCVMHTGSQRTFRVRRDVATRRKAEPGGATEHAARLPTGRRCGVGHRLSHAFGEPAGSDLS